MAERNPSQEQENGTCKTGDFGHREGKGKNGSVGQAKLSCLSHTISVLHLWLWVKGDSPTGSHKMWIFFSKKITHWAYNQYGPLSARSGPSDGAKLTTHVPFICSRVPWDRVKSEHLCFIQVRENQTLGKILCCNHLVSSI